MASAPRSPQLDRSHFMAITSGPKSVCLLSSVELSVVLFPFGLSEAFHSFLARQVTFTSASSRFRSTFHVLWIGMTAFRPKIWFLYI